VYSVYIVRYFAVGVQNFEFSKLNANEFSILKMINFENSLFTVHCSLLIIKKLNNVLHLCGQTELFKWKTYSSPPVSTIFRS